MADHIKIVPASGTYVVRAGGAVLGESRNALELREDGHDPVIYFPPADVEMVFLEPSDLTSTCPYKGQARYYSIVAKNGTLENAVWSYETPKAGVEEIAGYLAFDRNKVAVEKV